MVQIAANSAVICTQNLVDITYISILLACPFETYHLQIILYLNRTAQQNKKLRPELR